MPIHFPVMLAIRGVKAGAKQAKYAMADEEGKAKMDATDAQRKELTYQKSDLKLRQKQEERELKHAEKSMDKHEYKRQKEMLKTKHKREKEAVKYELKKLPAF